VRNIDDEEEMDEGTILIDLNHELPHKLKAKARFWDSTLE
jgi:hypothetical protein